MSMKELASLLSAKEMQLLAAAWMSCETTPKPDYNKIAEICGYKNGSTASVMFGGVKRKLAKAAAEFSGTAGDASPAKSTSAKSTPASKKRSAAGDDDADVETPTPKKRGRKQAEEKVKEEPGIDEEEEWDLLGF